MKVLVLAIDDWANTGWRFSKCLEYLGYDVTSYKAKPHVFNYPAQIKVHSDMQAAIKIKGRYNKKPLLSLCVPEIKSLVEEHDVIHFIASGFIDTGADLADKRVVVNYGGSTYRRNPGIVSDFFNKISDASLIQCPDLLGLGAKNEHLIYYPVDTDFIQPVFNKIAKSPKFSHFPSSSASKGTQTILNVIGGMDINYIGKTNSNNKTNRISWLDNLKRMAECDVYIETVQPKLKGKRFGEWGNTTLEAAALGKIVITNTLSKDLYEKEYGELPLLVANNEKQLKKRIKEILSLSEKEIYKLQRKFRQWAEDKHSIPSTSKRLEDKIYRDFH